MITAVYAREVTVIIAATVILKMSEDSAPNVLREFMGNYKYVLKYDYETAKVIHNLMIVLTVRSFPSSSRR